MYLIFKNYLFKRRKKKLNILKEEFSVFFIWENIGVFRVFCLVFFEIYFIGN